MRMRPDLETGAALAVLLVCAAFIASFAFGLRGAASAPGLTAAEPVLDGPPVRPAGRLEVLNASGRSGMARSATAHLRAGGFDVVFFGNAPAALGDSSVVIDRTGEDGVAHAAARRLGIGRVTTVPDTTLYLDATVVLGRDWRQAAEPAGEVQEGWRARIGGWLRKLR